LHRQRSKGRPVNDFRVHELQPDVQVRVTRPMPALPPDLDARVETLWRAACERVAAGGAGQMFNGRVFSVDAIAPDLIRGHMTEYRRLVAQMEDHALFGALGIRSLSVCGVLRCADGVAIGRRPLAAIYQPGLWQLPPAGSVDQHAVQPDGSVNLVRQALTELREEIGLAETDVGVPTPLCVVEHPGSHVSDLGMALTTPLDAAAVLAAHRARGNGEYDPLVVLPFGEIEAFIVQHHDDVVPPAREFLARAGLLRAALSLTGVG
jgi:hypothetical protein